MKNLVKSNSAKGIYFATGIIAIVIIMIALITFTNSKLTASVANAKILFTEETHDFGKVEQGIVLEYSYKFTNEGDEALMIEKVQPSCGCTGATTDGKNEYTEGESGEIKITFNTQGREGHQEKHITVFTNDKENPQKELKFMCDIVSEDK